MCSCTLGNLMNCTFLFMYQLIGLQISYVIAACTHDLIVFKRNGAPIAFTENRTSFFWTKIIGLIITGIQLYEHSSLNVYPLFGDVKIKENIELTVMP